MSVARITFPQGRHNQFHALSCVYLLGCRVRLDVVSPTGIYNQERAQLMEFRQCYSHLTMLGRMGESREIGDEVVFLLRDDASYITRINLPIDS